MNAHTILVVDFACPPKLGAEVQHVLTLCPQPRFQVECFEWSAAQTQTPLVAANGRSPGLAVLTFDQPPASGCMDSLLRTASQAMHGRPYVVVAPLGAADEMPDGLVRGAADFWFWPLRPAEVQWRLTRMLQQLPQEPDHTVEQLKQQLGLSQFVGESSALLAAMRNIHRIAAHDTKVLIRGETGTGKEICARAIHQLSKRSHSPFIAVNCATLSPGLIANELFGHVPGAFTGAGGSAGGLIAAANRGTVFLDEIGLLDPAAQTILLRYLQSGEVRQVGSDKVCTVDVRVIAATNADLPKMVHAGTFRQDLYYRLAVVEIRLPALRERPGDIALLAHHFLTQQTAQTEAKHAFRLSTQSRWKLESYHWPGNVREVQNVLERAVILSEGPVIEAAAITFPEEEPLPAAETFKQHKARCIKHYLEGTLLEHNGNISHAAKAAGMTFGAYWHQMQTHQVRAQSPPPSLS